MPVINNRRVKSPAGIMNHKGAQKVLIKPVISGKCALGSEYQLGL
jgi:hypothetical protein